MNPNSGPSSLTDLSDKSAFQEVAKVNGPKLDPPQNVPFLGRGRFADFHRKILFNKLEYVALFKVSRPIQTKEESLSRFQKTEAYFSQLLKDVVDAKEDMENDYFKQISRIRDARETKREDETKKMEDSCSMAVNRCRRAHRANLSNAISILVHDFRKQLKDEMDKVSKEQELKIETVRKGIIETKTEALHRQDQIGRLKLQMNKYQGLLRKHNVALEAEKLGDEEGKTMNLLDHYQNAISLKEDKIKTLKIQVERAEEQAKQKNPHVALEPRRMSIMTSAASGLMPGHLNTYSQTQKNSVLSEETEGMDSDAFELSNSFSIRTARPSLSDSYRKRRDSTAVKGVMTAETETFEPEIQKSLLQRKLEETNAKYENYLHEERTLHQARIQIELIEHERIKSVYKERFHEDLQDCSYQIRGMNLISESRSVLAHVQNIFPINLRKGMSYMGIQCDLDGLGELNRLKPNTINKVQ